MSKSAIDSPRRLQQLGQEIVHLVENEMEHRRAVHVKLLQRSHAAGLVRRFRCGFPGWKAARPARRHDQLFQILAGRARFDELDSPRLAVAGFHQRRHGRVAVKRHQAAVHGVDSAS